MQILNRRKSHLASGDSSERIMTPDNTTSIPGPGSGIRIKPRITTSHPRIKTPHLLNILIKYTPFFI